MALIIEVPDSLVAGKTNKVEIVRPNEEGRSHEIGIRMTGYGDFSSEVGCGLPIVLEHYNGKWQLLVFADINREDPTHVIDMEGAREDAHKDARKDTPCST